MSLCERCRKENTCSNSSILCDDCLIAWWKFRDDETTARGLTTMWTDFIREYKEQTQKEKVIFN